MRSLAGEDGGGEGSDGDLYSHYDEEKGADGELRDEYPRALVVDTLGVVCITYAFDGVQGEVHHGSD